MPVAREQLGQLLLRERILVPDELEQALEGQVLYGGRLGTNLVDLNLLSVEEVGHYLSIQLEVPTAPVDALFNVSPEASSVLTAEQCGNYMVLPFSVQGQDLYLAMLSPQDLVSLDELAFLTGMKIKRHVTPELRLLQLLEKRHGIPREKRFLRVSTEDSPRRQRQGRSFGPRGPVISALYPAITSVKNEPAPPEVGAEDAPVPAVFGGTAQAAEMELVYLDDMEPSSAAATPAPAAGGSPGAPAAAPMDEDIIVEDPGEPDETFEVIIEVDDPEPEPALPRGAGARELPPAAMARGARPGPSPQRDLPAAPVGAAAVCGPSSKRDLPAATVRPPGRPAGDDLPAAPAAAIPDDVLVGARPVAVDIDEAIAALRRVADREVVTNWLVQPFLPRSSSVLFMVRGQMAIGNIASNTRTSRQELQKLVLSLTTPSMLQQVFTTRRVTRGDARQDPFQHVISRFMGWSEPESVITAPICHGDRVVYLLCIQVAPGTAIPPSFGGKLKALTDQAAASHHRQIDRHKQARKSPRAPRKKQPRTETSGGSSVADSRPTLPDGRYFITGHVETQNAARLWRAIDTRTQMVVAVNVLPPGVLGERDTRRLLQEMEILQTLRHESIPRVVGAGVTPEGSPYVVREWVDGSDLRTMLDRNPSPARADVAMIIGQVCSVLAAIHASGVVHGGLHPGSVLLDAPEHKAVKVVDFGVARGGAVPPDIAAYQAPERADSLNEATDVFAAAVMTYEMLGGRRPEPLTSSAQQRPPVDLAAVPSRGQRVIMLGLNPDPSLRPSAVAFGQGLVKALTLLPGR